MLSFTQLHTKSKNYQLYLVVMKSIIIYLYYISFRLSKFVKIVLYLLLLLLFKKHNLLRPYLYIITLNKTGVCCYIQ